MIRNTIITLIIILSTLVLASCEDKFDYGFGEIPEGMGMVSAELTFEDYTPALESRAGGNAVSAVSSLWVVVYNAGGEYIDHFKVTDYDTNGTEGRPGHEETPTACLKFKHLLPNGRYKIYAVANYDLSGYDSEDLDSEHDLRSLYSKWENDPAKVGDNAQMFGYFTAADQKGNMGGQKTAKNQWNYQAQTVVVNGESSLHAWLRRSASKVTVAFDTRNLRDNVFIYIKSVRLRDLPKYCYLGRQNRPASDADCGTVDPARYTNTEVAGFNDLVDKGEAIYFGQAQESEKITEATQTRAYEHWLRLSNSTLVSGVWSDRHAGELKVPGDNITSDSIIARTKREHGPGVEALYFYENSQPKGKEGTESDKRQDVTGKNANVTYDEGVLENNKAWKDARPYGTYVEVEGYYICNDSIKPGSGAIKYRFMLGKDELTDYDAERNHHYKLTMVFNGHANDVDFHIDFYNEGQPGFKTPPTLYVSYLYNQRHNLIAQATPKIGYKLKWVKAVVLDNEWRRHNDEVDPRYNKNAWTMQINQTGYYKDADKYSYEDLDDYNEIKDESIKSKLKIKTSANDKQHDIARNTEFGFLSLRNVNKVAYNLGGQPGEVGVPTDNPTRMKEMITNFRTLWFDPKSYEGHYAGQIHTSDVSGPRGFITYDHIPDVLSTDPRGVTRTLEDGTSYTIHVEGQKPTPNLIGVDFDRSYILSLPLYTRAKTLDHWAVYSGANPFYSHHRYARVRYIAHFERIGDENDWYELTSDTDILQARRIDNPLGIFRSRNSTKNFHVQLAYIDYKYKNVDEGYVPAGYQLFESNGPWTATIQRDPHGIVKLVKGSQSVTGEGGSITGKTGSYIDFTIAPNKTSNTEVAWGAVIEVKYHDNNCIHKIIVRQGMADVQLKSGGHYWAARNLYSANSFTRSPLSIGTFSKRRKAANMNRQILESNNKTYGVRKDVNSTLEVFKNTTSTEIANVTWSNVSTTAGVLDEAFGTFTIGKVKYVVPDEKIYSDEIVDNNDINFAFGTVYDVDATETILGAGSYNFSEPYNEIEDDSSTKGVRGVFAYSLTSGNNLFFPLGATGHGRRLSDGRLHYGTFHTDYLSGGTNDYRPMAYDLRWQLGAVYAYSKTNTDVSKDMKNYLLAMDINYTSYRVGHLDAASIYQDPVNGTNSSAMAVKLIRK